jgi:hypothetical protein
MVIAVNGQLIKTEHIYQITPVVGNDCWTKSIDDGRDWMKHSGFSFVIHFLNKKSHTIHLGVDGNFTDEMIWWKEEFEYTRLTNKVIDELEMLRDGIVKVWSENQNKYPVLEFNYKK